MNLIEGLKITPFEKQGNEYNFPDSFLGQVYRRIVFEKTDHWIFYDGSVRNTMEFIDFVKNEKHFVFFVKFSGEDVGFFWIDKFLQRSAFINYCFYRSFWGKKSLQIGRNCIDYILHMKNERGEYTIDVLLGLTPVNNKLAVSFLKKHGMVIIGRVPGLITDYHQNKVVDGLLSYKKRENSKKRITDVFYPFSGS